MTDPGFPLYWLNGDGGPHFTLTPIHGWGENAGLPPFHFFFQGGLAGFVSDCCEAGQYKGLNMSEP